MMCCYLMQLAANCYSDFSVLIISYLSDWKIFVGEGKKAERLSLEMAGMEEEKKLEECSVSKFVFCYPFFTFLNLESY